MKKQMKRAFTLAAALGMSFGLTISVEAAWKQIGSYWYYDMGYGRNATGWHKVNSDWYYFNNSGRMMTGWFEIDGEWYYLRSSGAMAHDQWVGDYYLGSSGAMLTNTWIGPYYVGTDGKWIPNYSKSMEKQGVYLADEIDEPVLLADLSTFYTDYDRYNKNIVPLMEDKLGNTYTNCIEYEYGYIDDRDIYVLDGQYATFSGTLFVPDSRSSSKDDWDYKNPYHFYIYGDDELLYYSPKMISTQYPVDFEVDVSGIDQLALCWHGGASTWDYEIGLANAMLYED